jgi:alanine racemase
VVVAFVLEVANGWRKRMEQRAERFPGLIPVVKGNGYGFGRFRLASEAGAMGYDEIAVGTAHEVLSVLPFDGTVIALTPALAPELAPLDPEIVVTVGNPDDLAATGRRRVVLKVAGSMQRYGTTIDEWLVVARSLTRVYGVALHLPLDATFEQKRREIDDVAAKLPKAACLHLSHLTADEVAVVQAQWPNLHMKLRVGTALWLGDKSDLRLLADVLEVRAVRAGQRVGYRQRPIEADGSLVMVTAGTAHGVQVLPDGRSPFHFERTRLALHEPPHMHTSMLFVPSGAPCPDRGNRVEVQQPLTRVWPDRVVSL